MDPKVLLSGAIAWPILCLVVAFVFHRRPVEMVCAGIALWAAVPSVASGVIIGSTRNLHPASWIVLMTFVVQIIANPRALAAALARRFLFFAAVLLMIAAALYVTIANLKLYGMLKTCDQVLVPFLAFWLISAAAPARPQVVLVVRNTVIIAALSEAVLALVQFAAHNVIFWEKYYKTRYWFHGDYHRWMGATDHPLVLSLLLAATIPLLCQIHGWKQIAALGVMASAIVVTEARTGIVAAAIGAVFVILRSRASAGRKGLTIVGLAAVGAALASSSLASGISGRIANDGGSAAARGSALDWFYAHWSDYLFTGGGIDSSFRIADVAGLRSSFENAFVMYAIDVGVIFALIFMVALFGMAIMSARRDATGCWFGALITLVLCLTFSSLQTNTIIGPLLFLLLAVAANYSPAAETDRPDVEEPATEAPAQAAVRSPELAASIG